MGFSRGLKDWGKAALFALVAATLVNALIFKVYAIPTPSMENTLLVGDRIFVSKFHYGAQTARTPIQFPLAHQKLIGDIPSYNPVIQLPQFRLPGISEVKRGDKVVFNYPGELNHPSDMRTYYIKRCVGLPGDIIVIKNQQLSVNGDVLDDDETMQHSYRIVTNEELRERFFTSNNVRDYYRIQGGYIINAAPVAAENIKNYRGVTELVKLVYQRGQEQQRLYEPINAGWSRDNYGPLKVPHKGLAIEVNEENLSQYGPLIIHYEDNKNVNLENGKLYVEGKEVTQYIFKRDYYFAMGDNRHNSADSRMWGFVPDNHIVGKALFVLWSIDKDVPWYNFFSKIRFNRLFKSA